MYGSVEKKRILNFRDKQFRVRDENMLKVGIGVKKRVACKINFSIGGVKDWRMLKKYNLKRSFKSELKQ